jgi:hypothetical protein
VRRASEWQKKQRQALREQLAARAGEISWRDAAHIPIAHETPGPARECQWIEPDGCLCNQPSVFGRSWCGEHARRVFAAVEDG